MLMGMAHAQGTEGSTESSALSINWMAEPVFWCQFALLIVVLVGAPLFSRWARRKSESLGNLKGLDLPKGSVRAMLALLIIGSFVNILVFGATVVPGEQFDQVVTAFGTLAGAVTGFYFAGRGGEDQGPRGTDGRPGEQQSAPNTEVTSPTGH